MTHVDSEASRQSEGRQTDQVESRRQPCGRGLLSHKCCGVVFDLPVMHAREVLAQAVRPDGSHAIHGLAVTWGSQS